MVTHYQGSKGPVEIATMPRRYALNALSKLEFEQPERVDEIESIRAHVENLEAMFATPENQQ